MLATAVRLIQPNRLLDALVNAYRRPPVIEEVNLKAILDSELFSELEGKATAATARIAGYDPARYVIAPEPGERLVVYVEPRGFSKVSSPSRTEPSRRFPNLTIRASDESGVFFDTSRGDGFEWCSPIEVYLQLMQGGKREQETAAPLREEILRGPRL
jgi:hypothetical protein